MISVEAKKPRVLNETLIFIPRKDLTEIKERIHKCRIFGLENFTISVKNELASSSPLTKRSQAEAKNETKDFNGSQEAKGFEGNINFYSKIDLTETKENASTNVENSFLKTSGFQSRMPWRQVGF